MIVMPLFGDQYDNAQRIEVKGFGIRLNPYDFEENVLQESIKKLLNDEKLP
jgi:UDP:flavonoid glycosyltransferase YjiC (YdhE family)